MLHTLTTKITPNVKINHIAGRGKSNLASNDVEDM